jgi:hypothetical protein
VTRLRALCGIALMACKPTASTSAPAEERADAAYGPIVCPDDTRLRGQPPPDGNRVWCETEAGVSHGPFMSWHHNGHEKTRGTFRDGTAHGDWTSWYDNGQLKSKGSYDTGERVGRWKSFAHDGTPQPIEPRRETNVATNSLPAWDLHVGIPACDQYVTGFMRCIDTRAPEPIRGPLRDDMAHTVEAWKQAAAGPGRAAVEENCRLALEAAKQAVASWGCEF